MVYGASSDGSHIDTISTWQASDGSWDWESQTGGNIFSLVVADGIIYCSSDDHHLYALKASNGDSLWNYQTGDQVVEAAAEVSGIVYISSQDHSIYALRANNGSLVWRYQTGDSASSSPAVGP